MKTLYYLIGMPGVGKSYYSELLAKHLSIEWIDLDQHIEKIKGDSISNIINTKGEEFFRIYEAIALRSVSSDNGLDLISTGGGTPCFCDNISHMIGNGQVIYLNALPEYLKQMYRKYDLSRPLAIGKNLEDYVRTTYLKRHTFYSMAHHIIDVSKGQESVIKELRNVIEIANDLNK